MTHENLYFWRANMCMPGTLTEMSNKINTNTYENRKQTILNNFSTVKTKIQTVFVYKQVRKQWICAATSNCINLMHERCLCDSFCTARNNNFCKFSYCFLKRSLNFRKVAKKLNQNIQRFLTNISLNFFFASI